MFAQDIASHPSFTERRDWGALTLCGRQDGVLLNISMPCLLHHTINRERGGNLEVAWLADESKSETLLLKPCRRAPLFASTRQHIDSGWNAIGLLWSRGLFHLAATYTLVVSYEPIERPSWRWKRERLYQIFAASEWVALGVALWGQASCFGLVRRMYANRQKWKVVCALCNYTSLQWCLLMCRLLSPPPPSIE